MRASLAFVIAMEIFASILRAAPPTTGQAEKPDAIVSQITQIEKTLAGLPSDSPDRVKLAGDLMRLRQALRDQPASSAKATASINLDKGGTDSQPAAIKTVSDIFYLSDLKEQLVACSLDAAGRQAFGKNGTDEAGSPISIDGERSLKGLYTHPTPRGSATVTYLLDKKFRTFVCKVGICDDARQETISPIIFKIVCDGKTLWSSKPISKKRLTDECRIDISGANLFSLVVECGGGNENAHAVWLEPALYSSSMAQLANSKSATTSPAAHEPVKSSQTPIDPIVSQAIKDAGGKGSLDNRQWAIGELGSSSDPRATDALIPLLHDPNKEVRVLAIEALYRKPDPSVTLALTSALKDKEIRSDLMEYLARRGDVAAVDALLPLARAGDAEAISAVGRLGDKRAVDSLLPLLNNPNRIIRNATIVALGDLKDTRATYPLLTLLTTHPSGLTADALGKIGDPKAVDGLFSAVGLPDERSRHAADALRNMLEVIPVPQLINKLRDPATCGLAHGLLTEKTGQDFPATPLPWEQWWQREQQGTNKSTPSTQPKSVSARPATDESNRSGATEVAILALDNSVAFHLDHRLSWKLACRSHGSGNWHVKEKSDGGLEYINDKAPAAHFEIAIKKTDGALVSTWKQDFDTAQDASNQLFDRIEELKKKAGNDTVTYTVGPGPVGPSRQAAIETEKKHQADFAQQINTLEKQRARWLDALSALSQVETSRIDICSDDGKVLCGVEVGMPKLSGSPTTNPQ